MINNAQQLVDDFVADYNTHAPDPVRGGDIQHTYTPAAQGKSVRLRGGAAVYVFSTVAHHVAPVGANRVLKVGRAGANSAPRFSYQHYSARGNGSTLAGAIARTPMLHRYLGVNRDAGVWLLQRADRDDFHFAPGREGAAKAFEVYARARLGPVFEGSTGREGD